MRLPRRTLFILPLLAGCAPMAPVDSVSLPPSGMPQGAGDPTRGAILAAAHVFAQPGSVAGNPAAVARTLGHLEYLTVELAFGGRWRDMDPLAVPALRRGRAEARQAYGFHAGATPQQAVDALYGAAAALEANDRAAAARALAPLVPAGSENTALSRLATLPVLPGAAEGTRRASAFLSRPDNERRGPFAF